MKGQKYLLRRVLSGLLLFAILFFPMGKAVFAGGLPAVETLNEADFIIQGGVATGLSAGVKARIEGKAVVIADNITGLHTIGTGAFSEIVSMTELTLGAGITNIEHDAFRLKGLTKLSFNQTGLNVANYAFEGNNINSIEGSGTFGTIGVSAFNNNNLSNLQLTAASVGPRAFAKNTLSSLTLVDVGSVGVGAFEDNFPLHNVDVNMTDPPANLFAAGAFGMIAKNPPIVVNIDNNANGITSSEPTVYLVNPITLNIEHRDITAGMPGTLIENIVQVMDRSDLPSSYPAPNKPGYSLETASPVLIDSTAIVNRKLTVVVNYKRLGSPLIVVSPAKQLQFPTTEPAFNAQKILQDVTFYDPQGNVIPAFNSSNVLDSRISLSPNNIPYSATPRSVDVVVTLKAYPDNAVPPGETNQSVNTTIRFEFQPINIADDEIIPGKGWKYSDFTYSGSTVTGLSTSGITRLASNPDLVLPDRNPNGGANITTIGNNAFANRTINTVDFEKMSRLTTIGSGAFSNNGLSGLVNLDKATSLAGIGQNAFANNNLTSFDATELPSLSTISYGAFMNNKLQRLELSNHPNLAYIDNNVFQNNELTSLNLENMPKLTTIGYNIFDNNSIERVVINNMPKLANIPNNAFTRNKLNAVEITNVPELLTIGNAFFGSNNASVVTNGIENLVISNAPKLHTISTDAFSYNKITSLDLSNLSALRNLSGFRDNKISTLQLNNLPALETINSYAFYNNQLTQLDLTNFPSLKTIGSYAFGNNPITDLTLDGLSLLQTVGSGAFQNTKITDLTLKDLPELTSLSGFNNIPSLTHVHLESLPKINTVAGFNNGQIESLVLKDLPLLERIGSSAFASNKISDLKLENLPNLKYIDSSAFYNNQIAASMDFSTLPSLVQFGSSAFANNRISAVNFTGLNNLTRIDSSAFSNNRLEEVELKNLPKLNIVGTSAFAGQGGYNSLRNVVVENLPELERLGGFDNNYSLPTVTPINTPKLKELYSSVFMRNSGSGTLDLAPYSQLTTIGPYAYYADNFNSHNDYTSLDLPNSVTSIGNYAFFNNKIKDIDLDHLNGLTSIGDYAFNTGSSTHRFLVADSLTFPVTNTPISLGREIAHVKEDMLDFRGTNLRFNLRSAKPFSVEKNKPVVMYFTNTNQVTWPNNIQNLDPANPTIIYIENYDGSLNPPAGILINPTKVTIRNVKDADGTPLGPDREEYISADKVIEATRYAGYRALRSSTTPSLAGDSFDSATRSATVKYDRNRWNTVLEFRHEVVPNQPYSDYSVDAFRESPTTTRFHVDTEVGMTGNFRMRNIPSGEKGMIVLELPPHASTDPRHISFPPTLDGAVLDGPPYYDPVNRRVIYKIARFTSNSFDAYVRARFKFDRLDTPMDIQETGRAYFLTEDGAIKGGVGTSQIFQPYYNPFYVYKRQLNGTNTTHYRVAPPGGEGKYTNYSQTYEFSMTSERRLDSLVIEDNLPTYKKWDDTTNSYVNATAVFDPAKNPGWTLSPDGTKVIYTVNKDTLENMVIPWVHIGGNRYDESYPYYSSNYAAFPKLILDYPKMKFDDWISNTVSGKGYANNKAAQDPDPLMHNNTSTFRILETVVPVGNILWKNSQGSHYLIGNTGDNNSEYLWQLGARSERVTVTDGVNTSQHDRVLKNIELWDYDLDGPNLSTRALDYKSVTPAAPATVYLYTNTGNTSGQPPVLNNKPNLSALTLVSGPITLGANQKYNLTQAERDATRWIRIVFDSSVTLTGQDQTVTAIIGSGNKNGNPFPKATRNVINRGYAFFDSEVPTLNSNVYQGMGSTTAYKYLQTPKPQIQTTKTANVPTSPNITNRNTQITYTVGYNALYKNLGSNVVDPPYYLPDFKYVDVLPEGVDLQSVQIEPWFTQLGGTMTTENRADGGVNLVFRMAQAPNGVRTIARITTSIKPSAHGSSTLVNRAYLDFTETQTDPDLQAEVLNLANTPEEGGKRLSTATWQNRLLVNDVITGTKYIRKSSTNGAWETNIITLPNEEYEYKLIVANNFNYNLEGIEIFDLLPYLNDRYSVADGQGRHQLRGSEFEPILLGVQSVRIVSTANSTDASTTFPVTYFNSRAGFPSSSAQGTTKAWVDAALANSSMHTSNPQDAKAIHFGGLSNSNIPSNSRLEIVLRMKNPNYALADVADWDDTKTYNTFAYKLASNPNYSESYRVSNTLDAPKKNVAFRKVNRATGEVLAGAKFKLEQNNKTYEAISNGAGMIFFNNIEYMPYTVSEVTPPAGYRFNPDVISRNLSLNDYLTEIGDPNFVEPVVDIPNDPIPPVVNPTKYTLTIHKKNNNNNIANVRFELENRQDGIKTTKSTNVNGIITYTDLYAGQYTLRELSNLQRFTLIDPINFDLPLSAGFIAASPHNITLDDSNPDHILYTIEVQNQNFDVNFVKIGMRGIVNPGGGAVYTPDTRPDTQIASSEGTKLAGVRFEVYRTNRLSDGSTVTGPPEELMYTIMTDALGASKLTNLIPHRIYKVKEINTPAGYTAAPDAFVYVNDAGKLFAEGDDPYLRGDLMLVSNKEIPKKSSLTITKVDVNDHSIKLQGVVFKLYKQNTATGVYEEVTPNGEVTTGADGIAQFSDIEYGNYRVLEHVPKNGYISMKEPYDFVVRPYTESHYQRLVTNRKFNITALKVELIRGPFTSNTEAQAALDALTAGGTDTTDYLVAENNIYKKLRGAEFELYENVVVGGVDTEVLVAPDVSPANNAALSEYQYSSNLKANGSYTLKETTAPDGYDRISPQVMKIDLLVNFNNPFRTVYVKNVRSKGQVVITKYDNRQLDILPGAVFEIYAGHYDNESDLTPLTPVDTQTSNSSGVLRFLDLPFGDYTIIERQAPAGYQRLTGTNKITLNSANPSIRRSFYNRLARTDIVFRKVDDNGNTITNLTGSRFTLTVNGVAHTDAIFPPGRPGHFLFKDVPIEGVFVLTEQIAPDNYAIIGTGTLTLTYNSANPLDINPANNPVIDLKNKELINIQAKKTWVGGDNVVDQRPDVYFKLFRKTATTTEEAVNTGLTRVGKNNATVTMGTLLSQTPNNVYEKFDKYLHKADGTVELYEYYVKEVDSNGALLDMATYSYEVTGVGTLELTNTYVAPKKSLQINKAWTNGDTLTKPNLQFVLYRKIASETNFTQVNVTPLAVPTSDGSVTFADLDTTDANGNIYTYKVIERKNDGTPLDSTILFQPAGGAEKEVSAAANSFILNYDNQYESRKIQVTGSKTWVNGPIPRPTTYFLLYRYIPADGLDSATAVPSSLKQVDSVSNSVIWTDVVESNEQGVNYIYIVKEADSSGNLGAPENYVPTETGMMVTNTYKSPEIRLNVKKTWSLVSGETQPDSIRVKFTRSAGGTLDAAYSRTEIVQRADNWEKTFTGFAQTNAAGVAYEYHIEELDITAYDVVITGGPENFNLENKQKVTSRTIKKVWVNPSSDPNPSSVTVRILKNGVAYGSDVVLNAANNWEHTFTNLPAYAPDQNAYLYTFEEDVPGGYTPSFTPDPLDANTVILTNTLSSTSVEVTKTWVDAANSLDKPSSIRIILDRNGVEYRNYQLVEDANGDWKHTFTGLPERDARGNLYVYTVREIVPAGYEVLVVDYSITNTRTLVEYRVNKTWVDHENAYPNSITFRIHRDGTEINNATVTLAQATANGNWNHLFTEDSAGFKLPKTNPSTGQDYVYTVSEDPVSGFDTTVEGNRITNKRKINVVTARKVWIGGRKPATTLLLKRKVIVGGVETVDAGFERSFTVSAHVTSRDFRLPEFDGSGNRYTYYVEEPVVPDNYVLTINGTTATNRYVPPRVNITANKLWDGKFTAKPAVWFKLYRHLGFMVETEEVPVPVQRVYGYLDRVTWNNLPETNSNGDLYHYFVREVNPSGEDYTPLGFEKTEQGLVVVNEAIDMKAPKTGDTTNIWLLLALAFGSSLGAGLVLRRKRKH